MDQLEKQRSLRPTCSPRQAVDNPVHVAIGYDQILPTVIIVIKERRSPAEEWNCWFCNAHLITDTGEVRVAIIRVENAHVNTKHYPLSVGRCWSIYCRAPAVLILVAFDRS